MTRIVDDFNLPYLLAREVWGTSGALNEIVPVEVHTAMKGIEKNGEFSAANLTDMMFDKIHNWADTSKKEFSKPRVDILGKIGGVLLKGRPMTGSDFPFFKPSTSSFECDFMRLLRSSNRQRRVTSKRDVKCLYIDVHLDWIDAPYYYAVKFDRTLRAVPAQMHVGIVYHPWKTPMQLCHVIADARLSYIFTESDVGDRISRACAYMDAIDDLIYYERLKL